ncbi:hypothetical protein ACNOYE_11740 [Nannocystaceae bacterium ST9]
MLVGTLACSKVPNPYYVDELGDESGTAGETTAGESTSSDTDETTTSESSTSESTDTTDESDSSSSDTDCPPSESGCPCLQGTQCFPGLTCIEGICLAPEDCTPENPAVHVDWTGGMLPATDTSCSVSATMQDSAVLLSIGGCGDGVTSLNITLDPLPAELAPVLLGDTSGAVRLHFEEGSAFVRLAMPNWGLWLVDGMLITSSNPAVSDYPGEVVVVVGQCPVEPKFCGNEVGELARRGVRVLDQPLFDGASGLVDPSAHAWVDAAVVDCGVPNYRFAIVDWP